MKWWHWLILSLVVAAAMFFAGTWGHSEFVTRTEFQSGISAINGTYAGIQKTLTDIQGQLKQAAIAAPTPTPTVTAADLQARLNKLEQEKVTAGLEARLDKLEQGGQAYTPVCPSRQPEVPIHKTSGFIVLDEGCYRFTMSPAWGKICLDGGIVVTSGQTLRLTPGRYTYWADEPWPAVTITR